MRRTLAARAELRLWFNAVMAGSARATQRESPRRVVVTGLGVLSGSCSRLEELWSKLVAPSGPTHTVVESFDASQWMDRKLRRRTSHFAHLAVACGLMAREDAGAPVDVPERVGILFGVTQGGVAETIAAGLAWQEHGPEAVPHTLPTEALTSSGSSALGFMLGARGPSASIASACASGTHAVVEAFRLVRDGVVDVAYAGGSDAYTLPGPDGPGALTAAFLNLRVHTRGDRARPFDRDRDGFVMSDGAAALRLETLEAARARGVRIYAEVLGGGNTADAYDFTLPAPRAEGLRRAMEQALIEAGRDPAEVAHVNAHGTGTHANDEAEGEAIEDLFGLPGPVVTSTKGVTGHAMGAAGAIDAAVLALTIHHRVIPPVHGLVNVDPAIRVDVVRGKPRAWEPGLALSNSLGLGGQNGVVVFGPAPVDRS